MCSLTYWSPSTVPTATIRTGCCLPAPSRQRTCARCAGTPPPWAGPLCVATESTLAANGNEQDLDDYFAVAKIPVPVTPDFDTIASGTVYQIMMGGRKDEYSRILQDVRGAKIAAWWDRAVDIIPAAGGKGNGIAAVLQAYGIPKADAMAFGDGNNDLEMFGAVGTCVAMANGSADLKAAATHLCGSCA